MERKSNKIFIIFGSTALACLAFITLFSSFDNVSAKDLDIRDIAPGEADAQAQLDTHQSNPNATISLVTNANLYVPEISEEQYRVVKELIVAAEPSLAQYEGLDEMLRQPYLAQNIASLLEQVEEDKVTPAQVRASVRGAGTGDFSPTGEDCAAGTNVILMDPACSKVESSTTINENLPNYISQGCDNDPSTPCTVRANSVVEPWAIYGPESTVGYFNGTDETKLTENEKILFKNRQIDKNGFAYLPESGAIYGSDKNAAKYPEFSAVNNGIRGLLSPTSNLKDSPNSTRNVAVEICTGGDEACDESAKTLAVFKGTNSKGNYLSPDNSNMRSGSDVFGMALRPPGTKSEDGPLNQCTDISKAKYTDVSKTELVCLGSRRISDVGHGLIRLAGEISCRSNPNQDGCQLQLVTGIQIGSMFGDDQYSVDGGPNSNYLAESIVAGYSSPVADRNVTMLRTKCTIRIDYSKIVDVYCYFKNQSQYSEFLRQMSEKPPGKAMTYDEFIGKIEKDF